MYAIKFNDGSFLANGTNRNQFKTEDMNSAYKYISEYEIERVVSYSRSVNDLRFKDAAIFDLKTKTIVRKIKFYNNVIYNARITAETQKACLINDLFWIPSSQMEIDEEEKAVRVSDMILKNKFKNAFEGSITITDLIELVK
jgi:hypothetical protein